MRVKLWDHLFSHGFVPWVVGAEAYRLLDLPFPRGRSLSALRARLYRSHGGGEKRCRAQVDRVLRVVKTRVGDRLEVPVRPNELGDEDLRVLELALGSGSDPRIGVRRLFVWAWLFPNSPLAHFKERDVAALLGERRQNTSYLVRLVREEFSEKFGVELSGVVGDDLRKKYADSQRVAQAERANRKGKLSL